MHTLISKHLDYNSDVVGRMLASDPDACCHINKVVPLEPLLRKMMFGSMEYVVLNHPLKSHAKIQPTKRILRYHPLLDWDSRMVYYYIEQNSLPRHPLENEGFVSIGCRPCTRKWTDMDGRDGRWAGLNKTECGLHTTLGS